MNIRVLSKRAATAALPLLFLASCLSGGQKAAGIKQLDDLLGRVERVHLEAELCHQRAADALTSLQVVLSGQSDEGLIATFTQLQEATKASEEQGNRLRAATGPLKASSEAHFQRWTDDLAAFSSPALRQKSQERMDKAREAFNGIQSSLGPAQSALEVYNKSLKDLTLFLANDISTASLASIDSEVGGLVDQAMGVDQKLTQTMAACRKYVQHSAPAAGTVKLAAKSESSATPKATKKPAPTQGTKP